MQGGQEGAYLMERVTILETDGKRGRDLAYDIINFTWNVYSIKQPDIVPSATKDARIFQADIMFLVRGRGSGLSIIVASKQFGAGKVGMHAIRYSS